MGDLLKRQLSQTDAEYDEELRFAGAGILRTDIVDTEYLYPPKKWGAPYHVQPIVDFPAEVNARFAALEARIAALEAGK